MAAFTAMSSIFSIIAFESNPGSFWVMCSSIDVSDRL
jgi:hypothetical protein